MVLDLICPVLRSLVKFFYSIELGSCSQLTGQACSVVEDNCSLLILEVALHVAHTLQMMNLCKAMKQIPNHERPLFIMASIFAVLKMSTEASACKIGPLSPWASPLETLMALPSNYKPVCALNTREPICS